MKFDKNEKKCHPHQFAYFYAFFLLNKNQESGSCNYDPSNSLTTVTGYVDIPQGDENALTTAVAKIGPISV